MAGLGGRMSTVIKAKVSKILDKAEDPAETLDYSYQKQLEALQNVKKGIADVVTSKKRPGCAFAKASVLVPLGIAAVIATMSFISLPNSASPAPKTFW